MITFREFSPIIPWHVILASTEDPIPPASIEGSPLAPCSVILDPIVEEIGIDSGDKYWGSKLA
jgi:hypothetical protein